MPQGSYSSLGFDLGDEDSASATVAKIIDPLGLFGGSTYTADPAAAGSGAVDTSRMEALAGQIGQAGANLQAPQGTAAQAGPATNIDLGGQQQWADAQSALYQQLSDMASGRTPSAAQMMLQQAQDRATAQMMGASAATAGTNYGAGRRELLGGLGEANLQAQQQMGALRAQEQERALGAMGQLAGQGREAELGIASENARMAQEVLLKNADLAGQMAELNPQLQLQTMQLAQQYMAMGLDAESAMLQAVTQAQQAFYGRQTDIEIANTATMNEGGGGLLG